MPTYTPLVTLQGQAKIADAIANDGSIVISHLAVGDGNGATITPLETMTALVHEVDRVAVASAVRDVADPTKVIVTATLPVDNGPYTIREIALFTSDGQMFALGAYPETFKPTTAQGVAVEVDVQFVIQVSETANVVISIDPTQLIGVFQMLRAPFIAVDQHLVAAPPAGPSLGMLVTVGAGATGAFAGQDNKLAQWNGSIWGTIDAVERTVVGDKATGKFYRRTATGWTSFDPDATNQGLATLATTALMTAGTDLLKVVTPALAAQQAQSGSWLYGADTGAVNALTVTLTPPPAAYVAGMSLRVKAANANTGAATINVNGLGAKSIVKVPGSQALAGGEWKAGDMLALVYDGTKFQVLGLGARAPLTQAVDIYVDPGIGSDALYDGSAAAVSGSQGPFATLTKALAFVGQFAPGTFGATIHLSAGTFDAGTSNFATANWAHCNVMITGAGDTTILKSGGSAQSVFTAQGPNNYGVQLFAVNCTSNYAGLGMISAQGGAIISTFNHITNLGCTTAAAANFVYASVGSQIFVNGFVTLAGTMGVGTYGDFFIASGAGAYVSITGAITISAAVTCGNFAEAFNGGQITAFNPAPTFVNPGNVTGKKYNATLYGLINTQGAGVNFFPGTVAGTATTGLYA